jgi:hypothetical protein
MKRWTRVYTKSGVTGYERGRYLVKRHLENSRKWCLLLDGVTMASNFFTKRAAMDWSRTIAGGAQPGAAESTQVPSTIIGHVRPEFPGITALATLTELFELHDERGAESTQAIMKDDHVAAMRDFLYRVDLPLLKDTLEKVKAGLDHESLTALAGTLSCIEDRINTLCADMLDAASHKRRAAELSDQITALKREVGIPESEDQVVPAK